MGTCQATGMLYRSYPVWKVLALREPCDCGNRTYYYNIGGKPAHRVVYERTHGPIPDGLTVDHICRNKGCTTPSHLEAVTAAENTRRGNRGYDGELMLRIKYGPRKALVLSAPDERISV